MHRVCIRHNRWRRRRENCFVQFRRPWRCLRGGRATKNVSKVFSLGDAYGIIGEHFSRQMIYPRSVTLAFDVFLNVAPGHFSHVLPLQPLVTPAVHMTTILCCECRTPPKRFQKIFQIGRFHPYTIILYNALPCGELANLRRFSVCFENLCGTGRISQCASQTKTLVDISEYLPLLFSKFFLEYRITF